MALVSPCVLDILYTTKEKLKALPRGRSVPLIGVFNSVTCLYCFIDESVTLLSD